MIWKYFQGPFLFGNILAIWVVSKCTGSYFIWDLTGNCPATWELSMTRCEFRGNKPS